MTVIKIGPKINELISQCYNCKCKFLFNKSEIINSQSHGGYVICPECETMQFLYIPYCKQNKGEKK